MRVCACACVCVCVRARVYVCVCVCVDPGPPGGPYERPQKCVNNITLFQKWRSRVGVVTLRGWMGVFGPLTQNIEGS